MNGSDKYYDAPLSLFTTLCVMTLPPTLLTWAAIDLYRYNYISLTVFVFLPAKYALVIAGVFGGIIYWLFVRKKRYQEIYEKFKNEDPDKCFRGRVIAFSVYAVAFILSVAAFIIIYENINQR